MAVRGHGTIRAPWARAVQVLPLAALLVVGEAALSLPSAAASAQGFGNLFDRVFGGRSQPAYRDAPRGYQPAPRYYIDPPVSPRQQRQQTPPPPRAATDAKRAVPRRDGAAAAVAAKATTAPLEPVAKAADARVVLVVGDFMALSLAKGLEASTAANPSLRIVDRTDGSSGLVRDDHFDWPERLGSIIEEEKPAAVVVMLGANDRQAIRTGGMSEEVRSEAWTSEYTNRMNATAEAVAARKLPLVWVGLPSFRSAKTNDDVAYFNELYRQAATTAGGEFADVWDGFVDANGAFASNGPDIAGQPARLRNADGITMTPQGARKLAFFAEKPLEKVLGGSLEGIAVAALPSETKAVPQNPANATAVPVIAMNSPSLDGGETLLAAPPGPRAEGTTPSPRERLIDEGAPLPPSLGRADDFAWNAKGGPIASPQASTAARQAPEADALRTGSAALREPAPNAPPAVQPPTPAPAR